jgi:hypothetical protein
VLRGFLFNYRELAVSARLLSVGASCRLVQPFHFDGDAVAKLPGRKKSSFYRSARMDYFRRSVNEGNLENHSTISPIRRWTKA